MSVDEIPLSSSLSVRKMKLGGLVIGFLHLVIHPRGTLFSMEGSRPMKRYRQDLKHYRQAHRDTLTGIIHDSFSELDVPMHFSYISYFSLYYNVCPFLLRFRSSFKLCHSLKK